MLEAPSGWRLLAIVVLIVIAVLVIMVGIQPVSKNALTAEQAKSAALVAAERERTERAALTEQTTRHAADLRAEQMTSLLPIIYIGGIGVIGLLVVVVAIHSLSWAEGKQTQRTLLLLEAQRQARQLPAPQPEDVLLFSPRKTRVEVYE